MQRIREQATWRSGVTADRGARTCPIETQSVPTCSLRARSRARRPRLGRCAIPARLSPDGYAELPVAAGGSARSLALRCARRPGEGAVDGAEGASGGVSEARGAGAASLNGRAQRARTMASCGCQPRRRASSVRDTTLLAMIVGVKHTKVKAVSVDDEGIVADVAPTTSIARCSGCSCRVRKIKDRRKRFWRHLDLAGMRLRLSYVLRRVDCPRCGVCVESVPWAEPGSWFTHDFEEQVAYLAQITDKTTVVNLMRVAWRTVGAIVGRVVDRHRPGDPLDGLIHIGVDELSFRKHHAYITVVIDHVNERVVWAHPGKSADTLGEFFKRLGPERCKKVESVTMDMSPAYLAAVKEAVSGAKVIFDRFHVQRLAHAALDEVRRAEVRASASREEGRVLKRTRSILNKNPWNLTNLENEKLTEVKRVNAPLYRAYLMKETLAEILDGRQVNVA